MKITSLREVVEYQLCCGCGLCASLFPKSIRMVDEVNYGRRPHFLEDIESQQILNLCPGLNLERPSHHYPELHSSDSLVKDWGPIVEVWEGHAADPEIRFHGSSGGALTALSLYCLEHEKMHGVLHTSSETTTPYLNKTVLSEDRASLLEASGSRYSPASPCEGLQLIEQAPAPCIFIGKPCDAAAVHSASKKSPLLSSKLGVTMACFCAGTPSTQGTLKMLEHMGVQEPDQLQSLRYRGRGWPGNAVACYCSNNQQVQSSLTYDESWGDILQKYRQWRCYICPDHTGEFADIACGDPWYKTTEEGGEGKSLLIARTPKGQQIIEKAIATGYLIAEKVDSSFLPASQPNLLKTRARLWGQLFALRIMRAPTPFFHGFNLFFAWWHYLNAKEKLLSLVGTVKRIYIKRIKKRHPISMSMN